MANRTINFFQRLRAALMKASGTENTVLRVRAVQTDGKRYNPVNHGVSMKKLDESPYMVNLLKPHPTENNAFELLIDADTLIESLEDAGLYDTVAANFRVSGNDLVYDRVKPDGTIIQAGVAISGLFSAESDTFYGSGVPDNGTGNDGDEYLDTTSGIIYQKESGVWVVKKDLNTLDNQIASEVPFDPTGTAFDSGSTDVDKALKEAGSRVQDLETELIDHETRISANEAVAHSHSNKAILDTYTQTEADLADAVTKKHIHANAEALNSVINSESVDKYLSGTTEYVPIHMTLVELRNYTGNANKCVIHYNGTAGVAVRDDSIVSDNIGTQWIDGSSRGWRRIYEYIIPEYFGSPSNGVNDDSVHFKNALQFCADNNAKFITIGSKYLINNNIDIILNENTNLDIDFGSSEIELNNSSINIGQSPVEYLATTFISEPTKGDPSININDVTGISKGDLVEITSPALTQLSMSVYHYYVVSEVIGNDVYIEGSVISDINSQQIIDDGQSGSISVKFYKLAKKVTILNGSIKHNNTTGGIQGVYIKSVNTVNLFNVDNYGNTRYQIYLQYYGFIKADSITFKDFGYKSGNSGYVNDSGSPDGLSYGYGIEIAKGFLCKIENCIGERGWHTVDASRGAMHTHITNCIFLRNSYGVSAHEGAWELKVLNCTFDGNLGIIGGRCAYLSVIGCRFLNQIGSAISYSGENISVHIESNLFDYRNNLFSAGSSALYRSDTLLNNAGAMSQYIERTFVFNRNRIIGEARVYVGFFGEYTTGSLIVKDNDFSFGGHIYNLRAMGKVIVSGNKFDKIPQIACSISLGNGGQYILLSNNEHLNDVDTFSNSALFQFNGTTTTDPTINIFENKSRCNYLIRLGAGTLITNCIGNTNFTNRLSYDSGTIINAINNCFKFSISNITTVTNSVNNNVLT